MKIAFSLLLLLCLISKAQGQTDSTQAASAGTDSVKKQLLILPGKLGFNLQRGDSASQAIIIKSTLDDTMRISFEFVDWERDSVGKHKYYFKPGFEHSCARWVSFDRSYLEVLPGQTTSILVTMKVPDSAEAVSEMKWAMLLAKPVEAQNVAKGMKVETRVKQVSALGIHIYQTPPTITAKEVSMVSFSELSKNMFRITSKNTGPTQAISMNSIELTSVTGEKTVLGPFEAPMFPGQRRVIDFQIPETLAKGKYTAMAIIDVGDDEIPLEVAQKEIEIK